MNVINPILVFTILLLVIVNSYSTETSTTDKSKIELEESVTTIDYNQKNLISIENKSTTQNSFVTKDNITEIPWYIDALKDIAYYLRAYKFNEYDRRYEVKSESAPRDYFKYFPRPALRSLHWEVHKYCETSFLSCVEYLNRQIRQTGLKRADDTAIVMQEQQWNYLNHSKQIDVVESECRKMQKADDIAANPFQGPIEKFQWRTTASYYMCWYTMNEVSELERLKENCDNFANCLDPNFGINNKDPRADDNLPYSCALYSFCPDQCCPLKHLNSFESCWNDPANPCFADNPVGQRQCSINRLQNSDFRDIVLNRWNVTCKCFQVGFEWNSKYGMCVDIDECLLGLHNCNPIREACVNLPGSFRCACRWGYVLNVFNKTCEASTYLNIIKAHNVKQQVLNETKAPSIIKKLFYLTFYKSSNIGIFYSKIYIRIIFVQLAIYFTL
ncbi:hypothetical protein RN001_004733 [Aquatica leii]|uniref:EGF-like domain-containing protein n=1 Tax=Aquatica leii TaxID=1421715 RepID=A0AAN7SI57_9COLE|nr:hypothetical protein RN001_004733 [Aquatica leii]